MAPDDNNNLIETLQLAALRSLAIVGMGKNAGKTTVLNHILAACHGTGFPRAVAMTSIGLDGEEEDRVTGGVKPRIFVERGDIVATARGSMARCDAVLEVLALTGIYTATGEVAVLRAQTGGYIELAGPSSAGDLALCESYCRKAEQDALFLVDGALSRKSSAGGGITEAVILVAGAANAPTEEALVRSTVRQVELLTLPVFDAEEKKDHLARAASNPRVRAIFIGKKPEEQKGRESDRIEICRQNEDGIPCESKDGIRTLELPSLLGREKELVKAIRPGDRALVLRGAITDRIAEELLSCRTLEGMTLVAEDGTRFFLKEASLDRLERRAVRFAVLHPLVLTAVFFNPMRRDGSLTDGCGPLRDLLSALNVPVMNLGPALV